MSLAFKLLAPVTSVVSLATALLPSSNVPAIDPPNHPAQHHEALISRSTRSSTVESARAITDRARLEVERGVFYDASYQLLDASGDVPPDRGACTDLVVRAYRAGGIDLQQLVHEDVRASARAYGVEEADPNVDHRRVPTLQTFFERHALRLDNRDDFRAADVVFFTTKRCYAGWPCIATHVAIVSDRVGPHGLPLVLQNGGPRATESDGLVSRRYHVVGHFRLSSVGDP